MITIILLGVLVIAHEFGHFIIAKKMASGCRNFAVGMGPEDFFPHQRRYGIQYSYPALRRLLSHGGEAEDGASSSTSFLSKSVGARMAVMAAGPVMNFLLAFLMIFGLTCTTYTATPVIKEVLPDSAAAASGLEVGDRIQKIDGKTIHIYDELQYTLQSNHGESLMLDVVDAAGTHHKYKLQPKLDEKQGRYLIGFSPEVKTGLLAESVDGYAKMGIAETARYSLFAYDKIM